jgi:acyl carrier protein
MMTTQPQPVALDRETIAGAVRRVLAGMVHKAPESLTEDTRLFAGLGLDSTDTLELLMLIEDDLEVRIDADTLEHRHLETIGSLTDYFAAQAGV